MKTWSKVGENETLEQKLEIIEKQVDIYKIELERMEKRRNRRIEEERQELEKRNKRLEEKRRNEKHWEMMRRITKFMKENKETWEKRRNWEITQQRKEEESNGWRKLTEIEKIKKIKNENTRAEGAMITTREEKIKKAKEGRKRWKEWRENEDDKIEIEDELEAEDEPAEQPLENKGGGSPRGLSFQFKKPYCYKTGRGPTNREGKGDPRGGYGSYREIPASPTY